MPKPVIACALLYYKRFFLTQTILDVDPDRAMMACVYLAGKVEDQYRPASDICQIFSDQAARESATVSKATMAGVVVDPKQLLRYELPILEALKFELVVHTPYPSLLGLIEELVASLRSGELLRDAEKRVEGRGREEATAEYDDLAVVKKMLQVATGKGGREVRTVPDLKSSSPDEKGDHAISNGNDISKTVNDDASNHINNNYNSTHSTISSKWRDALAAESEIQVDLLFILDAPLQLAPSRLAAAALSLALERQGLAMPRAFLRRVVSLAAGMSGGPSLGGEDKKKGENVEEEKEEKRNSDKYTVSDIDARGRNEEVLVIALEKDIDESRGMIRAAATTLGRKAVARSSVNDSSSERAIIEKRGEELAAVERVKTTAAAWRALRWRFSAEITAAAEAAAGNGSGETTGKKRVEMAEAEAIKRDQKKQARLAAKAAEEAALLGMPQV